jgi:hypothetical protein
VGASFFDFTGVFTSIIRHPEAGIDGRKYFVLSIGKEIQHLPESKEKNMATLEGRSVLFIRGAYIWVKCANTATAFFASHAS